MSDIFQSKVFGSRRNNVEANTQAVSKDNITQLQLPRFTAEGNISNIQGAMSIIKKILDICMPEYSLTLVPGYSYKIGAVPTVTYSLVNRSKSSITPLKRKVFGQVKEVVDGKYTGDVFNIYNDFFDCMVEFNFFGNNANEMIDIKDRFESIIETYTGDLRLAGVDDIYFMDELSPTVSTMAQHNPIATLVFFMRLQKLESIRLSAIKSISSQINKVVQEESSISDILASLTENNTVVE